MDTTEALQRIAQGRTCLWAGAGVAMQLALAGRRATPSWHGLITTLEREADVLPPSSVNDFASRLDVVLAKVGRPRFQRLLRREILTATLESAVEAWRIHRGATPEHVVSLAHLGFLANPIVNFNIETLSSQALVAGSGPWHPVAFQAPVPDALTSPSSSRGSGDRKRHQRRVYHPHGAIDLTGICVMTEREYRAMHGTLALQLAAHAAFGLDLAIVGMSLEDQYLRVQLELFRDQIKTIFWFVASPPGEPLNSWAYRNRVEVISTCWPDFWRCVARELPGPGAAALHYEWLELVQHAMHLSGNPLTDTTNNILHGRPDLVAEKANWFWKATLHGEEPRLDPQPLGSRTHHPDEGELTNDILIAAGRL